MEFFVKSEQKVDLKSTNNFSEIIFGDLITYKKGSHIFSITSFLLWETTMEKAPAKCLIGFKQYKLFEFRFFIQKDLHDEIKPVNVDKSSRPTKKQYGPLTTLLELFFLSLHCF